MWRLSLPFGSTYGAGSERAQVSALSTPVGPSNCTEWITHGPYGDGLVATLQNNWRHACFTDR